MDNFEERDAFIRQTRTEQGERETPLLYFATNFKDEISKLTELIKIRLSKNERIGIILPKNRQVFGLAKGLIKAGLDVEHSKTFDFNNSKPKILTYHGVKGLTFDSIIMPRLVIDCFDRYNNSEILRLLFIAISRAKKWVVLITNEKNCLPQLENPKPLSEKNILTIQIASSLKEDQEIYNFKEDDDLLDLF